MKKLLNGEIALTRLLECDEDDPCFNNAKRGTDPQFERVSGAVDHVVSYALELWGELIVDTTMGVYLTLLDKPPLWEKILMVAAEDDDPLFYLRGPSEAAIRFNTEYVNGGIIPGTYMKLANFVVQLAELRKQMKGEE